MIKSMTAFAKQQAQTDAGSLTWEIRSVNNRFLDVNMRLPEGFRDLEPEVRALVKQFCQRGKLDFSLQCQSNNQTTDQLSINRGLLKGLSQALNTISEEIQPLAPVDSVALLRWPGLLQSNESNSEAFKSVAKDALKACLEALVEMRKTEGERIRSAIRERINEIQVLVDSIKPTIPELLQLQERRLRERFEAAKLEVDEDRLAQELVHLAQKTDVHEELDRLSMHCEEMSALLNHGGVLGRKMDFITQELHREANTLGSKSVHEKTTQCALNLKVLIEQIREQVQNIE